MSKGKKKSEISQELPQIVRVENYLSERYDFRYNIISNEVMCKSKDETDWRDCNENDLFIELLKAGFNISENKLRALMSSSFVEKYDPLQAYFDDLPEWNPETDKDYIQELASYVKTTDTARFERHFKKMFVRFVACATTEVENKHAVIFIGKQHDGKSRLCDFFSPNPLKPYSTETFATDKDGEIALTSNFIINLDELSVFSKSDINSIKTVMQKTHVKVRPPYGRKAVRHLRRANFVGNTNQETFLADETGSVRWLCFEVLSIDWKGYSQNVDIDKVYAQANQLFQSGFNYQLTREEILENEQANMMFRINTPEMEMVSKYYAHGTWSNHDQFLTATDILAELSTKTIVKMRATNIGRAMKAQGFRRTSHRRGGIPIYGYFVKRKGNPEDYQHASQTEYESNKSLIINDLNDLDFDQYSFQDLFKQHHHGLPEEDFKTILKDYCVNQNNAKKSYVFFDKSGILEVIKTEIF